MHSTCADRTTKAARRYVSPRNRPLTRREAEVRALSYALKTPDCDQDVIDLAAREMAALVADDTGYLIPVPDHTGDIAANYRLAAAVAKFSAGRFEVRNVLARAFGIESQCLRHRKGLGATPPQEHGVRRVGARPDITLDGLRKIYFVDNVITSGNTVEACRRAFYNLGTGLVYADAHYDAKN